MTKDEVSLEYRCKRCGAPFGTLKQDAEEVDLDKHTRRYHPCFDGGVGIGELVGFREHKENEDV